MTEAISIRSFIGTHGADWEDPRMFSHVSLEMTNILEGSGRFRWADRELPVETGQIVLIPPDVPHSFHAATPIRFGVILIEGLPADTRRLFDRLVPNGEPAVITFSRFVQEQYEQLFRQWLRVTASPLKEPERHYDAWLRVLLLFVAEHSRSDRRSLSVARVADYIREHLKSGVAVSELAALAGLSEEGLRKRFLSVYGMTPKQYHQMCRLTEAKWLLSSTEKDMQAIARSIGFDRLHSFSAWFKRQEGLSPSDWRKRQRLYHQ